MFRLHQSGMKSALYLDFLVSGPSTFMFPVFSLRLSIYDTILKHHSPMVARLHALLHDHVRLRMADWK